MARKYHSGWVTSRKIFQVFFLVIFLTLAVASVYPSWPGRLVNLPLRLDPLLMIAQSIASRAFVTGSLISLATLVLTLIFGRAWCGWICPVGTVLDGFSFHKKKRQSAPPGQWRVGKHILLIVILAAALAGNLTWMFLDPMTIWVRSVSGFLWPGLDVAVTASERVLATVEPLRDSIQAVDQFLRSYILPLDPAGVRAPWLPALIFAGIILLNRVAERFWCRYLCPLGGLLGLISKFALFKRTVSGECKNCGLCEVACPTGTIDPERGYQSDSAECTDCMDCLESCQRSAIKFKPGWSAPDWRSYDPDRRLVIGAGAVSLAGTAVLAVEQGQKHPGPFLLRPPGVVEEQFLSICVRCGECVRACPTGALQSSLQESGLVGLFTPVLTARMGYCLYSCNRCGQVCPVEAIPPLPVEEKQQQVIGWAFIDEDRCIPWADGVDCIVCEEMCPVPDKAIILEEVEQVRPEGQVIPVRLPHVIREKCIGCGICEYKCPRAGEGAIRVYRSDYV